MPCVHDPEFGMQDAAGELPQGHVPHLGTWPRVRGAVARLALSPVRRVDVWTLTSVLSRCHQRPHFTGGEMEALTGPGSLRAAQVRSPGLHGLRPRPLAPWLSCPPEPHPHPALHPVENDPSPGRPPSWRPRGAGAAFPGLSPCPWAQRPRPGSRLPWAASTRRSVDFLASDGLLVATARETFLASRCCSLLRRASPCRARPAVRVTPAEPEGPRPFPRSPPCTPTAQSQRHVPGGGGPGPGRTGREDESLTPMSGPVRDQ